MLSSELLGSPGDEADRISALPDDLLLLILARLWCTPAAARTTVLSRRWRKGLWARLHEIVFRGVKLQSLEPALARVVAPAVSLLHINVPNERAPGTRHVNSVLRATAWLAPEQFVFALKDSDSIVPNFIDIQLPCFHRATRIVLTSSFIIRRVPAGVEFPALETLPLSGCVVVDYNALLSRCPRLRVLWLTLPYFPSYCQNQNLHSTSLQKLIVHTTGLKDAWVLRLDIVAPSLKELTMFLASYNKHSISILAPVVEKVLWDCSYTSKAIITFAPWCLDTLCLQTAEIKGQPTSLHIHASAVHNMLFLADPAATFT